METVQKLIDAGVHFGCRVSRWNPKMAPYIYGRRSQIHVIDLRETIRGMIRAENFLYHLVAEGAQILWVGTKRQIKGVIKDAGQRTGMPVVTERWIGGTLTNFSVIRSRLRRLEELETMEEDGSIKQFSKKVIASLHRENRKISRNLSGIREMAGIPGAMVVVDPSREVNAIREAKKMGLAVIGLLDTDCDPAGVDIVIPGNDDALRSVRLLIESLVKAVEEGGSAHRENMAAVGVAERSEDTASDGEPRPTRAQNIVARGPKPGLKKSSTAPEATPAEAAAPEAKPTEAVAPEAKPQDQAAPSDTIQPAGGAAAAAEVKTGGSEVKAGDA